MHKLILAAAIFVMSITSVQASTLTVSGEYDYKIDNHTVGIIGGEEICFSPSARSALLLPYDPISGSTRWFCFNDMKSVAKAFGFPLELQADSCGFEGSATIEISNYQLTTRKKGYHESDRANLVSVIKSSTPEKITDCN
ncbi:hypothetical protein CBP31_02145 [Oceanisphaera profunda]|uniref:Uncharacterized protein n=1 Tax=Oceanisphaera profunda TaxID=1416627 RepID=A0A1Y0D3A4_9GAMM|nr:hypothetical protein [Oceanisphaera profunda]ART81575.1 hypothetical protein CBP31_02145 [Oceanisphaera profunda]